MKAEKLHFMFVPGKDSTAEKIAAEFISVYGQTPLAEAELKISIGGDGQALAALHADQTPVFAMTPAGSESVGFWTHHNVTNVAQLRESLEKAKEVLLTPLKAEIEFANGNKIIRYAFNDVAAEKNSAQSAWIDLIPVFSQEAQPIRKIQGDGLLFSTALGSTGTNNGAGGPIVDIENNVIIFGHKPLNLPKHELKFLVKKADDVVFSMKFLDVAKRPVRIDFDGHSISNDEDGSPVVSLKVSSGTEKTVSFLTTFDPVVRAYQAI